MKLIYVANVRIPTEKAHGIQIMNTCAALARQGADVELVLPWRRNPLSSEPFAYYGIERTFRIRRIFAIDLFGILPDKISFLIAAGSFTISSLLFSIFRRGGNFYGRDEFVMAHFALFHPNVFWETHTGSRNAFARCLVKRSSGIVCITKGLKDLYESMGASITYVSPDGVDIGAFDVKDERSELRKTLALPEGFLATYCGSLGLYSWKGVDIFLEASKHSNPGVRSLVVGGYADEIRALESIYGDKVRFVGKVEPVMVAKYLAASDVLVLPNKAGDEVSERFTSPMKLFEYMAAKRPIIASDLSSIREILNPDNAILVPPNDPEALAKAIERVASDKDHAKNIATKAFRDVARYTWDNRAKNLISFMSS